MSATATNAITNGLHAFCLLLYFLGALHHYRAGRGRFTKTIVGMFALLFGLKVMGVYVHYRPPGPDVEAVWFVVALLVIVLNVLVLRVVGASKALQIGAALLTAASAAAFVHGGGDFSFLALPSALVFITAALLSKGLLRIGFWMVVASNFAWIAAGIDYAVDEARDCRPADSI